MLTVRRLLFCGALLICLGVNQNATARRFGLQTGFYKEGINTPQISTGELGLRLGFYAERLAEDVLAANEGRFSDQNRNLGDYDPRSVGNLYESRVLPCGGTRQALPHRTPSPISSIGNAPVYLLVLPPSYERGNNFASFQPQSYYRTSPRDNYRRPEYQKIVRGFW